MNNSIILIISILLAAGIGGYLGLLISKLKSKSEKSTLEERNSNLQHQLTDLKTASEAESNKQNTVFQNQIEEFRETISKTEKEREDIRREKEFLNAELARRNTEYENLKQLNAKRDAERDVPSIRDGTPNLQQQSARDKSLDGDKTRATTSTGPRERRWSARRGA